MRIMGIDPGTARAGWGVIDLISGKTKPVAYGCIITGKDDSPENRLLHVFRSADELIHKYHPDTISIEELFFKKRQNSLSCRTSPRCFAASCRQK